MAGLDYRLSGHVDESAEVVSAGRRDLDAVREWVLAAAASVPPSPDGDRMLLPIVQKGIGQVIDIVERSNGDLNSIGEKIRALGDEYKLLGIQKFGNKQSPSFGDGDKDKDDKGKSRDEILDRILKTYQVPEDPGGTHKVDFPAWADEIFGKEIPTTELTAHEMQMLMTNPTRIRDVFDIKDQATNEAIKRFPPPDGVREIDNQTDAFRHAYANALMTQKFGAEWTWEFTSAHEMRDNNYATSEAMDLYNNEVGRRIAMENPNASPEELANKVQQAVNSGEMVVVRPDGQGLEWSDRIASADTGDSSKSPPIDVPGQPRGSGG